VLVLTVVGAIDARSAVVQEYVSTVVYALHARSAVGHRYASTVVSAIGARSAEVHDDHAVSSLRFLAFISKTISRHEVRRPSPLLQHRNIPLIITTTAGVKFSGITS
jgi:methyl coenzyme M reductase subunit C